MPPCDISALATPGLLLDLAKYDRNVERLRSHLARLSPGMTLRPHMKTVKSVELGKRLTKALGTQAITVSTLAEAEIYAEAGYRDILYAVGIAPGKLERVAALVRRGVDCQIVTDNVAMARIVGRFCTDNAVALPVLIEVDCDGHRAGVKPEDAQTLLAIAHGLGPVAQLRGVMTHGGGSYAASSAEALNAFAQQEASAVRLAASALRKAGFAAPTVSAGSTPTALAKGNREGVTEFRAGVFPFFDLVMAGIGVCEVDEIALSVLTSVIGHQHDKGWIICDAGWMAMSRDLGTSGQALDYGYGQVCDADGRAISGLIVASANQEHGIIAMRDGSAPPDIAVGTALRILPNHACATAAQHQGYNVVEPGRAVRWSPRFSGW